jgi:hypothetical protein
MKTSSTMVFLSTLSLTGALVLGSSAPGCRSDSANTGGSGTGTPTAGSSNASSGSSGTGGNTGTTTVTIQQITDPSNPGYVGPATPITIKGAVAMSIKFLVSKSSSDSCLWGVFLSAPGLTTTAAHTGVLALSYGTMAVGKDGGTAYCPTLQAGQPAGDAFPDDTAPGDVLDIVGETDSYVPASCSSADAGLGATNVPGIQVGKVTSATRTSVGGPTPAPYTLTASDLSSLAAASDKDWLDSWGNVYVQADNVVAEAQTGGTNPLFDNYGHMLLQEGTNGIQVGDKLYYVGYVKSTDICYSGPSFPTAPPISFTAIRGFVYLDYCNWGLDPRNKCEDLSPPSDDCAAFFDAGTDAGAATVCSHDPVGLVSNGDE